MPGKALRDEDAVKVKVRNNYAAYLRLSALHEVFCTSTREIILTIPHPIVPYYC